MQTWQEGDSHEAPAANSRVWRLSAERPAEPLTLSMLSAGERFAHGGRVYESADVDGDGLLEVRTSGEVLGRVVNTFERPAAEVIDAEVSYEDGSSDRLTGTPNHPFWVDALQDYVPLGELEVGTVLHVQGGGEAILVSKTWRQGDFAAERSDVGESPERSAGLSLIHI